jgi:hypothetical protein
VVMVVCGLPGGRDGRQTEGACCPRRRPRGPWTTPAPNHCRGDEPGRRCKGRRSRAASMSKVVDPVACGWRRPHLGSPGRDRSSIDGGAAAGLTLGVPDGSGPSKTGQILVHVQDLENPSGGDRNEEFFVAGNLGRRRGEAAACGEHVGRDGSHALLLRRR